MKRHRLIGCALAVAVSATVVVEAAGQTAAPKPKPPGAAAGAVKRGGDAGYDRLMKEAAVARDASRLDEALALYQKAAKLKPAAAEAHWYIGTLHYDRDRFAPARDAFRRVTELNADNGAAWSFKGLCEFQLKNYETALTDLANGRRFGFGGTPELVGVARYHLALLLTRVEEYEQAIKLLNEFATEGNDSPRVIEAMGIAALRLPVLPSELPGTKRQQVMMAGRAAFFSGARLVAAAEKAYEELVQRFPETPHVHYAFGTFLVNEQPDKALEQFKAELEVSPRHPLAKLQIAFEYVRRGEWEAARPWAEQAVTEAPTNFAARKTLGQVLLESGEIEKAISELEAGVKLAPDSPALRFTLASAYRRAGRREDAAREQAEFTRLDRMLRTERTGAQSVGGMEMEPAPPAPGTPQ